MSLSHSSCCEICEPISKICLYCFCWVKKHCKTFESLNQTPSFIDRAPLFSQFFFKTQRGQLWKVSVQWGKQSIPTKIMTQLLYVPESTEEHWCFKMPKGLALWQKFFRQQLWCPVSAYHKMGINSFESLLETIPLENMVLITPPPKSISTICEDLKVTKTCKSSVFLMPSYKLSQSYADTL